MKCRILCGSDIYSRKNLQYQDYGEELNEMVFNSKDYPTWYL
jgi:hypothetical protein